MDRTKRKLFQAIVLILLHLVLILAYLEEEVREIKQLSGTSYIDYSHLKIRKVNGSKKVVGKTFVHEMLDNSFMVEMTAFVKQGGQYRAMPYKLPKQGFCDFHNNDPYVYPDLVAVSDFPMPFPCPLPNGTYEVRGYLPSLKKFPTTIMPSGEYSGLTRISKDGIAVFEFQAFGAIINI